jgi:carbamoyl-phosphate synthase large subunit
MNVPVKPLDIDFFSLNYVGVKAPQFSFTRLEGADPTLGVEMASTGEVGCLGEDFDEAFIKALLSVGYRLPISSVLLSSGSIESKAELLESVRMFLNMGIKIYGTRGTANFLNNNNIPTEVLNWPLEKRQPNTIDYIKEGKIDLVINIPKNYQEKELTNDYMIRRATVDYNVPLITNRQFAMRFAEAVSRTSLSDLKITSWEDYTIR